MADHRSAEVLMSLMLTRRSYVSERDQFQALRILSGERPSLEDEPVVKDLLIALNEAIESRNDSISPKSYGELTRVLLKARAAVVRIKYQLN